ncbi:MAG TPA: outer membrane protein assembly factor BamA [Gemmataceae bacterium]|jgi:outer membrane protein insertion porin family
MQAMERFPLVRCAGAILCLLLGAWAVLAQGPAPTEKVLVSDVIIQGNQRTSTEQIKVRLHTQAGKEYDPAALDEDVREMYKTRQFSNIQTLAEPDGPGKVKVYFLIRDLPNKVQKVTFLGAKHIKEEELRKETAIRPDTPLNPKLNEEGCQKILNKYEEQGRSFASCILVRGGQLGDTEVVYQITEGPKVKVSDIQFIGNTFVSGARLATQIHSSHAWFHLLGGNYNSKMAEADTAELIKYFKKFGYQDVKVSLETQRSADGGEVTLIFHIQEGQRYTVKDIPQVVNAQSMPHEQVEAMLLTKSGEFLDENKVNADKKRIKDYYGYTGRDVQVQDRYVWSQDTPGVVQVQYEIEEHPLMRVGQIFIIGNTRTRDNVILRQVPLFPGQILTYPDLEIAANNLKRLNIFTSGQDGAPPSVQAIDRDGSPYQDIRIDVNEANTGSLIFGVGVNSNSGLTGSIVLNERNFDIFNPPTSFADFLNGQAWRGAGQEFRIQAMPGTQLQQYMATFREPFLFDTPNSLTTSGYYFTRIYNEYYEQREGGRFTLGRQINRFWNVSVGMRIENVAVNNVADNEPIDYQEAEGNNFQVGARAGVMRDTRDSFIRPTSGSQVEFSYEEMTGEHTFPLINLLANKYWTTFQRADGSGRQVLVYHGQAGWAGTTTPVYERFFAGGFTTIRGFQFRGVGPNVNGFMVGGDFMLLNSLEYQVPVKANDQIYLVGFVDSGTVSPRINEFDTYRVAAGFGVRFVIPMLGPTPIALDFGFPLHKAPGDITQVFNFWMGFTR